MGNDIRDPGLEQWLLARISHDMRSPFSSMIGVLQLILDEWETMPQDTRKDFVQDLLGSSRIQLLQFDNLAFLSRKSRGTNPPVFSEIQLSPCIELTKRRLFAMDVSTRDVLVFETPGNRVIRSDPQYIELLIMNCAFWVWHVCRDQGIHAVLACHAPEGAKTGARLDFSLAPGDGASFLPSAFQIPASMETPPGIENPDFNLYMARLLAADLSVEIRAGSTPDSILSLHFP